MLTTTYNICLRYFSCFLRQKEAAHFQWGINPYAVWGLLVAAAQLVVMEEHVTQCLSVIHWCVSNGFWTTVQLGRRGRGYRSLYLLGGGLWYLSAVWWTTSSTSFIKPARFTGSRRLWRLDRMCSYSGAPFCIYSLILCAHKVWFVLQQSRRDLLALTFSFSDVRPHGCDLFDAVRQNETCSYPTEPWRWKRRPWPGCRTGGWPSPCRTPSPASSSCRLGRTADTWWCCFWGRRSPYWNTDRFIIFKLQCNLAKRQSHYRPLCPGIYCNIKVLLEKGDASNQKVFVSPVPWYVIVHCGTAVEEYDDSDDGCRDQHLCVDP